MFSKVEQIVLMSSTGENIPVQPAGNVDITTTVSGSEPAETTNGQIVDEFANETPEDKYRREKLKEIAERKAAEVFVTQETGKYECQACGYVYDATVGLPSRGIAPKTPFETLEKFRCPQCGASKKYFVAETEILSGFKENLKYGLGGNAMTAGQKSNIIFGGLGLFFVLFLSGYLLN